MSSLLQAMRVRWASRELKLYRWLKEPGDSFDPGDTICELERDGAAEPFVFESDDPDRNWVLTHEVEEGQELDVWGQLLEYSDIGYRLVRRSRRRLALTRRPHYPRVFLNYRRDDAEAYAGRLHDSLSRQFGPDDVFMDIFSIQLGEVFPWAVQQAAAHCEVMVSVIGPQWLARSEPHRNRRIDSEFDFVRRELTAALDRGIAVLPVLTRGAAIPQREDLPHEMQGFEQLQMLEMEARHWGADADRLSAAIRQALTP
jgi:hypothetical protein